MRIFLNSNVLIDYWFKRKDSKTGESFHLYIEEILNKAQKQDFELFTSSFSISHARQEAVKNGLPVENFELMKDITLGLYSLKVVPVSAIHKKSANELMKKFKIIETSYFEDFVNIAVSLDTKSDVFLSRDKELKNIARNIIEVLSPKEFIQNYLSPQ